MDWGEQKTHRCLKVGPELNVSTGKWNWQEQFLIFLIFFFSRHKLKNQLRERQNTTTPGKLLAGINHVAVSALIFCDQRVSLYRVQVTAIAIVLMG